MPKEINVLFNTKWHKSGMCRHFGCNCCIKYKYDPGVNFSGICDCPYNIDRRRCCLTSSTPHQCRLPRQTGLSEQNVIHAGFLYKY